MDATKSGDEALASGDDRAALAEFSAALDAIGSDTSHPMYVRAKLGSIRARSESAPSQAAADLLVLHADLPTKIGEADFNGVIERMGSAGNFAEAIQLLSKGLAAFPDSKLLDALGISLKRDAQEAAERAENPEAFEALEDLEGLGYL